MRAFNQRLTPKEFGGVPLAAAVALLAALAAALVALMLPGWTRLVPLAILFSALGVAAWVFSLGEDWRLRRVRAVARNERDVRAWCGG